MIKNYYQILGLQPNCTKDDIKKAYRIYAIKFHPDKQNSDKFFEERFNEIKEAYDILIDDNKRTDYDRKLNSSNNYSSKSSSGFDQHNFATNDILNRLERQEKDRKNKEKAKRKNVYYTSKDLVLNGLYINCGGRSYGLSDYDKSVIRKDDNSSFIFIGIFLIIIGIFTISFFVGIFFLMLGIFALFYKEYFVVLIGKQGDIALIKGRKAKMKKISNLINQAIEQNK